MKLSSVERIGSADVYKSKSTPLGTAVGIGIFLAFLFFYGEVIDWWYSL